MIVELNKLRNQIDTIDQQVLNLLSKRFFLVKKICRFKHKYGLPFYSPDREAFILKERSDEAIKLGLSPQFIRDILSQIINESMRCISRKE
ncbi:T-protein [Candidatus Photodesmus katoptron]|uniref:chorismate mutase n=1 Tax=Candidatus Photodesmus katoptron Akat1 TaxID=1236703 RepID=S3DFZ8_9GAMM|nr:chorismate mutase [Candidatus Photodesmus katoptron]EPE37307.1 chorismate mutase [Candidatus Photodesmus katoptron Akat1]KEY90022.1 T-protein [Candidatus Photodesmus katoptron]